MAVPVPASAAYTLGAGDSFDVTVSNHPDLNTTLKIRPDGRITMARAGDVMAQGKTPTALAKELETLLARTLNNAHVQINIKEVAVRQATLSGSAIKVPGAYAVSGTTRVMDLVAIAGGLSTKPNRIQAQVVRNGRTIALNIANAQSRPASASNVSIRPNDVVILNALQYQKITVTGAVATPGQYEFDEDLTVVGLLGQAGNLRPEASQSAATVQRGTQMIPLDLTPQGLMTPTVMSFRFQPGDTLSVPVNTKRISIVGQVVHPAFYPLPEAAGENTVMRAITGAGGSQPDGDLTGVTITRTVAGKPQTIPVNAQAILMGTAPDAITLQADDIVFVPKRDANVNVVGPVQKPGAYPFTPGMTLISLLAQAGQPTEGAGIGQAYIMRDNTRIPINLRAALSTGTPDPAVTNFLLQKGDYLVIPDTSDQIIVTGQLVKPGPYNLDDGINIVSLVTKAGGTTPTAALSKTYVLRAGKQIPIDLTTLNSANPDPTLLGFTFESGDTLVVPENKLRVSVIGAVMRPGELVFPENANDSTIIKTLTRAGGPSPFANLRKVSVVRVVNNQNSVIPIDLSRALRSDGKTAKSDDIGSKHLLPGDTLFIEPKNTSPNMLQQMFGPLLSLGAGVLF